MCPFVNHVDICQQGLFPGEVQFCFSADRSQHCFFKVKDAERERRGEALWGEDQGSGRLRLFLWVCSNTENTCQPRPAERTTLFGSSCAFIHPSTAFPLTGSRACTSKCHKNANKKQKKDITKCCPTVYLFQCNTRDQEIITAHTTDDLESLDDHEIVRYYKMWKLPKFALQGFSKNSVCAYFLF